MKSSSHRHSKNSSSAVHRSRRKNKSKRRRRRNASSSYSESARRSDSSPSISASDSDDIYRSRRPRARDIANRTSKRSRRSSSSSEGRVSTHRRDKRSESKKSTKLDKRKKPIKKKRLNARSPSSDSTRSCSTCQASSGSSSEDSEIERTRRSNGGKFSTRGRSRQRVKTQKRRHRSWSHSSSSCSGRSRRSHGRSTERAVEESFPRRLGSVVRVVKDSEEKEQDRDENKAEIIPAYDDCPSRSNDSYEGGRKRENEAQVPNQNGQLVAEKVRQVDEKVEYGDHVVGAQPCWSGPPSTEETNEVSVDVGSSKIEDLESLLRQKALENFKRFRNGLTISKSLSDQKDRSGVSKQLAAKGESSRTGDVTVDMASSDDKSAVDVGNSGRIHDRHKSRNKSAVNPLPDDGFVNNSSGKSANFVGINNKSSRVTLALRPDTPCNHSMQHHMHVAKAEQVANDTIGAAVATRLNENQHTRKENLKLYEYSEKLSEQSSRTEDVPHKKLTEVTKAAATPLSMQGEEVKKGDRSGPIDTSHHDIEVRDQATTVPKDDEAKGGSQYEQKTMSVMRGGEMVQVSYKVYIPKKAPALARRQLKR